MSRSTARGACWARRRSTPARRAAAGWLEAWGRVQRVGVEGTGSYGAGLARRLGAAGMEVAEVVRPNREMRRRRGKSDAVDAEAAARAALSGADAVVPKSADGCVEAIRLVAVARRSAIKARTVARRHRALTAETAELDRELLGLCEQANPALLGACGVGAEVASSLLIAAGDNPERMRSEAAFAALCGTSPIEASSGQTTRHRLNRGGNRQANNALRRIAMIRLRIDQKTIDCAARRAAEGKTRCEILRCLKRHIAREIYNLLTDPPQIPRGADLRQQRTRSGLTIAAVVAALNTPPTRISELERGLHHNSGLAHRYQQHLDQTPNRQT